MKVLVAHNAYQQRGGEDVVVDAEVAMLREAGHEVEQLTRHNDELASMGRQARLDYEARYTPERNLEQLLAIYRQAISVRLL